MDWLDKLQNSQERLRALIRQIDKKAWAFAEAGNDHMAVVMDGWAYELNEIETQNHEAIGEFAIIEWDSLD